ncbi:hypothetical protein AAFN88_20805 [Pelagibius sp. CAU 1746]|uniref:hypothetical protein n=1 Tax=Pelagibius sp. CAU 1746 TaxID=3140370 RepID=UPI00325BD9D3
MTDSMATQPSLGRGDFSVGGVLKRSFSTFFANFVPFLVLALILYLPSLLLGFGSMGDLDAGTVAPQYTPADFAVMALSVVLSYILIGALVYGTVQHLTGRSASLGDIIGRGLSRVVPVIVIAILLSIAVTVGFVLLVVPGIFLVVVYSVVIPAAVVERPGIIGSFKRSWELTKGYRWPVLGLLLILFVILVVFSFIVGAAAGFAIFFLDSLELLVVVNYVISAISGAFASVMIAVLYHDLRVAKEGVSSAQIAAVFD